MSDESKHIDNIIFKRNGTNQQERFNSVLAPGNLDLHDFDIEDWVLFAYNFAKHVNFFDLNDDQNPAGDWQEFFNHFGFVNKDIPKRTEKSYQTLKTQISEILADLEAKSSVTPHMTLFICFLKLLELSKQRFNQITKKHLDFFYQDILQIEKLPATADKVHIIFELAKRSVEERIKEGTELDGAKDANGNKLIFKTTEDLIANKTSVTQLKSLFNDINLGEIKYSAIANSLDGQGEALPKESNYWLPFGYTSAERNYTALQDARLGFAIASPMFDLQEGERNIDVSITFETPFQFGAESFSVDDLLANIDIQCSGEEAWLGPFSLSKSVPFKVSRTDSNQSSTIAGNQLRLVFQISKDTAALTKYDNEKLGELFSSSHPIIRFIIKTENQKGHFLFRNLVTKVVKEVKIKIDVRDIKSLTLDSDTGVLNAEKPFYPFTTQPVKGSSFSINYPEMFSKKWTDASINIKWKNTPNSFVSHYEAYKLSYLDTSSRVDFDKAMFMVIREETEFSANQPEKVSEEKQKNTPLAADQFVLNKNVEDLIVATDEYFKATLSVLNKEEWDEQNHLLTLFNDLEDDDLYETNVSVDGTGYDIDKSGPIRLSLNQSFYHSLFPRIYTLALTNDNAETLIPNDPYTPFADTLSLSYTAEESTDFSKKSKKEYISNRITLFHENPFGQYEEHSYLKEQAKEQNILGKNMTSDSWLVPDYCHGGELYIGLKDAEISQQISLLIQVLEGSENPTADSFSGKQKVEWAILCDNQWKGLEDSLLANGIDNFLRSGIVKFSIPKQATKDNTRLPKDIIWIRAKMHKSYDAVCKVIDVKAQAVLAQFQNNNNDLNHLYKGLPAETISKLIDRIARIKSVSQPFNSFDGIPLELDHEYYRRVSERLRHKNRAITLWDYEHLVMQEFSEVYRVKCLNHTSEHSFLSPGDVTLVVVPDIINKNVFDIYEPRLSKATLNKIQNHINRLNTMHVDATVINPEYMQVVVKLKVKFYLKYDENFYTKQLNEDITKFLSPWAFDTTQDIVFGVELNRSIIIDYIEKLYYVDYLAELEMAIHPDDLEVPEDPNDVAYLNALEFVQVLAPPSPKHILVSAKIHAISTDIKPCIETNIEEAEKCQY